MPESNTVDLRFPIGKFESPGSVNADQRSGWISSIAALPVSLAAAVDGLANDSQLDTPYRDGGWTVRQVVHHVADSHLNSYIRFRWALTEDLPLIKAYDEKLWALLPDARELPVEESLTLLRGLHGRWTALLRRMTEPDFKRRLRHPVSGELSLEQMTGLYAWHGRHHVAHIVNLKNRLGW